MKKKLLLGTLAFFSASVLAACGAAPSSNTETTGVDLAATDVKTIKLGYNLELSGPVAAYGLAEKNAADLAVEEINAAGGVDGKAIEVVALDNKSETSEAATVATSLATESKVATIIGPATSTGSSAAIPNVTEAGVPMITPSGTLDELTLSKDGSVNEFVFRATFQDSYQGNVLSQYATNTLKAKKVALLYDKSSDYSKKIAEVFKKEFAGEIVTEESFQSEDKDFQALLTNVKSKDFDAVVLLGYYTASGLITKQARELGIDQPILGPDGFNDEQFIESAGAANASNVYYVSGYSTKVDLSDKAAKFVDNYKKKYGEEPNMFAALAYDSVYMFADAAKGAKSSKEIATNLATLKDFEGVTGTMTMDDKHNPVKPAIMIELQNGKEVSATAVETK
ncbi:ABC transporter substrate-binding protein [Streptococcus fryi]